MKFYLFSFCLFFVACKKDYSGKPQGIDTIPDMQGIVGKKCEDCYTKDGSTPVVMELLYRYPPGYNTIVAAVCLPDSLAVPGKRLFFDLISVEDDPKYETTCLYPENLPELVLLYNLQDKNQ